jgi:deferrochelatase/peroxidase EfeB
MPINLAAPLSWTKANPDELKMLQCLQGNILKGHGRDFTANIFFRLDPTKRAEARRMLRDLANFHLISAHGQLLDTQRFKKARRGGTEFAHLALAFKGYEALGLPHCAPVDPDFRAGMKATSSIHALNDPAVCTWETPFQAEIHGVVLAAHESESRAAALAATIKKVISDSHGSIIHVQHGKVLRNAAGTGIENFGYVDGRSQPLMLQEDIDAENSSVGSSRWNPAFPLSTALLKDPGTADNASFGSLFVFRKLEQAVRDFKRREQVIADTLGLTGDDRELAGAMIVGRFEDGTPVTLSRTPRGGDPPNNFNYSEDPGTRCPFHAHIRKVNARGSGGGESESFERSHLMPRRGIPYEDLKRTAHPAELPESATLAEFETKVAPLLPCGGVGLLFMAYNSEIARQFKFTQQSWANNTDFPRPPLPPGPHGIDPVIGQGTNKPGDQKLPKEWDNPAAGNSGAVPFDGFVRMRGGEYFFSPSLTFLLNL